MFNRQMALERLVRGPHTPTPFIIKADIVRYILAKTELEWLMPTVRRSRLRKLLQNHVDNEIVAQRRGKKKRHPALHPLRVSRGKILVVDLHEWVCEKVWPHNLAALNTPAVHHLLFPANRTTGFFIPAAMQGSVPSTVSVVFPPTDHQQLRDDWVACQSHHLPILAEHDRLAHELKKAQATIARLQRRLKGCSARRSGRR